MYNVDANVCQKGEGGIRHGYIKAGKGAVLGPHFGGSVRVRGLGVKEC